MTKNTKVREISDKSIFPDATTVITSTTTFASGDLLVFDDTLNKIVVPTLEADGATFLGVAVVSVTNGHAKDVYTTDVDASVAITSIPGPVYGSVFKSFLKVGDVLNPGDSVFLYPTGGTNFVQAAGTKAIGIYQGKTVTAVTGTEVEILYGARHPGDTLRF